MSQLRFEREHALGLDEAVQVTQRLAELMKRDYRIDSEWQGSTLSFGRPGVRGTLSVEPARIVLDARLGPLLSAFAPRIRERLEERFAAWYGERADGGMSEESD